MEDLRQLLHHFPASNKPQHKVCARARTVTSSAARPGFLLQIRASWRALAALLGPRASPAQRCALVQRDPALLLVGAALHHAAEGLAVL